MTVDCKTMKNVLASPHYEDPATNGCRSDEEAT